ncbi:MAG: hypothetical protein V4750_05725 [Pseudomonadota bacterium]
MLVELRRLRQDLADAVDDVRQAARLQLAPTDRRELARLLPLVAAAHGDGAWSAATLWADALNEPAAVALREMLAEWVTPGGGLRAFGRFLERCRGIVVGVHQLEMIDRPSTGTVYMVKTLSRPAKAGPPLASTPSQSNDVCIATHPTMPCSSFPNKRAARSHES